MPLTFTIPDVSHKPLVLRGLTKRYGTGVPVIAGMNASFAPGTATGLVGPNGSGKTTLLRLLAALAYPTAGRVLYGDLDVHAHPYRYLRHVGLVYADGGLPEHLSAAELLEWILRERGRWDADAPGRIAEVLDAVLLDERRDNLVGSYSSGMAQKTQIAAALVARPGVLLMDEPFRGLDAPATDAVLALLRGFTAAGGLLVLSSHAHTTLTVLCDTILDEKAWTAGSE